MWRLDLETLQALIQLIKHSNIHSGIAGAIEYKLENNQEVVFIQVLQLPEGIDIGKFCKDAI